METLQRTANRGSISTGYDIENSCKLERANSEKLSRTPSSASNSKTWTYSFWVKRTQLGINSYHLEAKGSGDRFFILGFNENDNLLIYDIYSGDYGKVLTMKFRDTSAWYHIVLAIDTTDGTAGNRNKFYVNGVLVTDYVTDYGDFPQNYDTQINKAVVHNIGYRTDINQYASGYIAETCFIDGTQLGADSFGEVDSDSGIWKPIDVSGLTFGTNGFYQEYKSSSALGADTAPGGNSNDYAASNIAAADQATDSPSNVFCTLNPLMANAGPANYLPITEGGTKAVNAAAAYKIANSTIGVSNGKWYWEVKATDVNGVTAIGVTMPHYWDADYTLGGCIYYGQTGQRYNNSSAGAFGATYTDGDIISFALDMDATPPTMTVYKNNSSQGNLMAGLSINGAGGAFLPVKEDGYFPKVVGYNANTFECNFGGYTSFSISSAATDENGYGTFEYAPPTGYYALCTKNLAEYG